MASSSIPRVHVIQIVVRLYTVANGGWRSNARYGKLGERFIAQPYLCLASDQRERSIARLKWGALKNMRFDRVEIQVNSNYLVQHYMIDSNTNFQHD
jgi:hypothetical protein